jgi:hypothetical protein
MVVAPRHENVSDIRRSRRARASAEILGQRLADALQRRAVRVDQAVDAERVVLLEAADALVDATTQ